MRAVIVEAAINGVTSKERNPHVPCLPAEIAADALACLRAGVELFEAKEPERCVDTGISREAGIGCVDP